jgi:hypothetical protein
MALAHAMPHAGCFGNLCARAQNNSAVIRRCPARLPLDTTPAHLCQDPRLAEGGTQVFESSVSPNPIRRLETRRRPLR